MGIDINGLTLGQIKEIAAIAASMGFLDDKKAPVDHGCALVVADRGHVWIGQNVATDSEWCRIKGAQIVRFWGTEKGVNELVNGPLPGTKLDAPADLVVNRRAVIAIIPCEAEKWSA